MYGINCQKAGAQEYYNSIFRLYAQWGVDFVKVDDICNTNAYPQSPYSAEKEIEMIRSAIDGSGREMVLSLSPGPAVIEKAWHMRKYANMWRITDDFWDDWTLLKAMFERCEVWQRQVSPGCWPDCDMLPLGRIRITADQVGEYTRFTPEEQITMMTLWCIFRSPLMIGAEMPSNDEFTLSLLQNREVLRLIKHSMDARQIFRDDTEAAWCSMDEDGSVYVALFNLSDEKRSVSVGFDDLDLSGSFHVKELWSGAVNSGIDSVLEALLPAHGAVLYKLMIP